MRREDAARHVAAHAPPAGTSRPPGGAVPAAPPAATAALLARGCALRPGLARPGSARLGGARPVMAASVFCCLRWCRDGGAGHIPLKEMPAVQLDTQRMGERSGLCGCEGRRG